MDCKSTAKSFKMSNCHLLNMFFYLVPIFNPKIKNSEFEKNFNIILRLSRFSLAKFVQFVNKYNIRLAIRFKLLLIHYVLYLKKVSFKNETFFYTLKEFI
jgi:hypothetical protein